LQTKSIFVTMLDRNAERFHSVYEKAERLFSRLAKLDESFSVGVAKHNH
jgi:hypothetical protein